jgi:hypothetical protein
VDKSSSEQMGSGIRATERDLRNRLWLWAAAETPIEMVREWALLKVVCVGQGKCFADDGTH